MRILSPSGRLNRLQYLIHSLCAAFGLHAVIAVFLIRAVMSRYMLAETGPSAAVHSGDVLTLCILTALGILGALCAWVMLVSQVKRLHDLNQSGWLVLINLIPTAGLVMWVILVAAKGEDRTNPHGLATA